MPIPLKQKRQVLLAYHPRLRPILNWIVKLRDVEHQTTVFRQMLLREADQLCKEKRLPASHPLSMLLTQERARQNPEEE